MKNSNLFKFAITIIFLLSSINVYSSDIKIIKNPKPNMVESNYVQLKKIKTVSADLGRDEFLFNPVSITIDSNCNLFVYDTRYC